MSLRFRITVGLLAFFTTTTRNLPAQAPVKLTLIDAKTIALSNHPQVLMAQNEAAYANQQVTISRSPYFPTVSEAYRLLHAT